MHFSAKVTPSRAALRQATRALLARPFYPAWQDGAGEGAAFSAALLLPRLRARLARGAAARAHNRSQPHAPGRS